MNFKNSLLVICAAILTFSGMFVTVRSCNAADAVAVSPKTQEQQQAELLLKASEELEAVMKARAEARLLTEKVALVQAESRLTEIMAALKPAKPEAKTEAKPEAKPEKDTRTYVRVAKEQFSDLVPVYAGNEVEKPSGFGKTLATGLNMAEAENGEASRVKVAVINRLQEAHTRAVLDQDTLHVPEYTALLNQAPRNEAVLETIQKERLADEASIEKLANPSFWQSLKWWWNS